MTKVMRGQSLPQDRTDLTLKQRALIKQRKLFVHYPHGWDGEFEYNPNQKYFQLMNFKPAGFWLSDDSRGRGWYHWRLENGYDDMPSPACFEILDFSKLLIIDVPSQLPEKYKRWPGDSDYNHKERGGVVEQILWRDIAKHYSGIYVRNYSHDMEHRWPEQWYYAWDCDSACIWDLSVISPYNPDKPIKEYGD